MLQNFPIKKIDKDDFPESLLEIPQVPKQLFIRGDFPLKDLILLSVVGSRKYTPYGKDACKKLIEGLRGYPVCIVSGLALGIDSIAHETALSVGLKTIAIPGSGLEENVIYPKSNLNLAKRILENGGCLISEFEPKQNAALWTFPQRNRIMAGLSKAVLVIEAEEKSGTLITARLATEYNRDVLTVPGSIFSSASSGPHMLIRLGATPVKNSEEILETLGIETQNKTAKEYNDLNDIENKIIESLSEPLTKDELLEILDMNIQTLNTNLMMLEIKGYTKESSGKVFVI